KHREGADQAQRHGDSRDNGRPEITQEHENHHHHQDDGEQQRELHVDAWSTGSIALTRPTVSMTLAPGWRWIARMIARFWLNQAAISSFSPALTARPISRMRTGDPLR